jgi:hypothetical protein
MHDLRHLRPFGRRSLGSIDHRSHLAEELWPDLCRTDDSQSPGIHSTIVGKPMNRAPRDAQCRPDSGSIDMPSMVQVEISSSPSRSLSLPQRHSRSRLQA